MIVLGIETSCDETAAAVVAEIPPARRIRSNEVYGQAVLHAPFGGVVPEISARAHLDHLDTAITRALVQAEVTLAEIDGVAAAAGDRKSTRLNSSHLVISYAVFCLKK